MQQQLNKQSFQSEAEEAQWWDDHQDDLTKEFQQAAAEGRLAHGTVARVADAPATTIRLDPEDILKARAQAETKGLRYQVYLAMLLHEALNHADDATSPKASER